MYCSNNSSVLSRVLSASVGFFVEFVENADSNDGEGDPQFWQSIRAAITEEDTTNLLEDFMDVDDAPSPNDAERPRPSAQLDAIDRMRDAELAEVLNKTEFMIVRFYQKGHLTLRLGQFLFDMLRHPDFNLAEVRSDSIVKLHRQLERPFAETAVQVYNLWNSTLFQISGSCDTVWRFDLPTPGSCHALRRFQSIFNRIECWMQSIECVTPSSPRS